MRLVGLIAFAMIPVLMACPKKKEAVAVPPPVATPVQTQEPVQDLKPIQEEDAGVVDAGSDAGKKPTGPGVPANVARLKQCCAQLAFEGKKLGASPEGGMLMAAAMTCNTLAAQAGPTGSGVELSALRNALKGRTIPPICAGL
jgi:hypothetical protein